MNITEERMEIILNNSYKDFHVKGFDYICLQRSHEFTLKVYFFDGDIRKAPEVIYPHDHRYHFDTMPLAGTVMNKVYRESYTDGGFLPRITFNRFHYMTPLNGGNGFEYDGEAHLQLIGEGTGIYSRGRGYVMKADQIHTIRILAEGTILMLKQYEDIIPFDQPTVTYSRSKEPPSLSGLYNKFTPDEVIEKLKIIEEVYHGTGYTA